MYVITYSSWDYSLFIKGAPGHQQPWYRCCLQKSRPCTIGVNICNVVTIKAWEKLVLLTHWGRVTHICVSKLAIIGSDNGLAPRRRQAIIWTNAGILLIGPLGIKFNEILIGNCTFSFKKMHLKMSSAKWRPFCLGPNVLTHCGLVTPWCRLTSSSTFIQAMVCYLLGTMLLHEPMLLYLTIKICKICKFSLKTAKWQPFFLSFNVFFRLPSPTHIYNLNQTFKHTSQCLSFSRHIHSTPVAGNKQFFTGINLDCMEYSLAQIAVNPW